MSTFVESQTTTSAAPLEWFPDPMSIYRLTVGQYEAMVRSGIFTKRDRVHLINWSRQVEVYSGPGPEGYQSCVVFKPGESVPLVIDGIEAGRIHVDDMLPRQS